MNFDDALLDILNQEIARELLLEKDPAMPDTTFNLIWAASNGNPYNCPVLYEMLKLTSKL